MKSKLRNIIVNNQRFVYWYRGGKRLIFYFTPKEDKNIKFELIFNFVPPNDNENNCWGFYALYATINNNESIIELVKPKFIAMVIEYLLLTQSSLFTQRKIHIIDAVELINKMGYSDLKPVWEPDW